MAFTAQVVIDRVIRVLQDKEFTQWELPDLLDWLDEAVQRAAALRPDAVAQAVSFGLAAGVRQQIPVTATQLIRLDRNVAGRVCSQIKRDDLDDFNPNWPTAPQQTLVHEWMFDSQSPTFFWVSPPNNGAGTVEAIVAIRPAGVTALSSSIALEDAFASSLVDYVLHRAFDQSTEETMKRLAQGYFAMFVQGLGLKRQVREEYAPSDEVED